MEKKVTIKDIARIAGVSIATVSYVLNDRKDKRISEETRKHVLHTVNMMNYTSNFAARFISTGRSNIIAVYTGKCSFPLHKSEQFDFMLLLAKRLESRGYSLRFIPNDNVSMLQNVDAIVCYDTVTEHFRIVGNNNYVPLVAVNFRIDDELFYQITDDYEKIRQFAEKGGYTVVSCDFINADMKSYVKRLLPELKIVTNFRETDDFCRAYADKPVLALGRQVYDYLVQAGVRAQLYPSPDEIKAEKIIDCIELAIKRENTAEHDVIVG